MCSICYEITQIQMCLHFVRFHICELWNLMSNICWIYFILLRATHFQILRVCVCDVQCIYLNKLVTNTINATNKKNRINLCKQTAFLYCPRSDRQQHEKSERKKSSANNNDEDDDKMHPIWYSQLKTHNYNNI